MDCSPFMGASIERHPSIWHMSVWILNCAEGNSVMATIAGMFTAMICFVLCIRPSYTGFLLVLHSPTSQDVSVPGLASRILDWTGFYRTSLCHIYIPYWDILQGSSRLCNWLSLRCLGPWINHLPPVCWSTFRKPNFKLQRGIGLT